MLGTSIVVASNPRGLFLEGTIDDTSLPGTAMEMTPGAAFSGQEPHWRHYQPSADGDPRLCAILLPDMLQGQLYSTAYVAGARCFLYCPVAGEDMNVLVAPQAGTSSANAYTIGERLIPSHSSGEFIAEATSSFLAWFMVMEHVDIAADQTGWVWARKQF